MPTPRWSFLSSGEYNPQTAVHCPEASIAWDAHVTQILADTKIWSDPDAAAGGKAKKKGGAKKKSGKVGGRKSPIKMRGAVKAVAAANFAAPKRAASALR